MREKLLTLSALAFSGTLALNAAAWSQTTPGGSQGAAGQKSGTTPSQPRDSEGGEPVLKGQGRGTAGQSGQAQQGRGAATDQGRQPGAEASKQPRDSEGGQPFGGSKSTVQGYPESTGSGSAGKSRMSGRWSRENVKEVQEALRDKGHNPGAIDGVMGSKTQKALRDFQQANNIKATGTLDAETAAALGVENDQPSAASGGTRSEQGTSAKPKQPRDAEGGEPFLQKEREDRGQSVK